MALGSLAAPGLAGAAEARSVRVLAFVDGLYVYFDAYRIGFSTYVKLRDIASALANTTKRFDLGWDARLNAITLTSGVPYPQEPVPLTWPADEERHASASQNTANIFLDGAEVKLFAYNIGGSNYFRMADIGRAFDFFVEWDEPGKILTILTLRSYEHDETTVVLSETEDMGQEYIDSMIFLGDSTTYGLLAYGILTGGRSSLQVWTPANRTFSLFNQKNITVLFPDTNKEITVENAVALKKPEYMVITLGVNGVSTMEEGHFKREYIALIARIREAHPETRIILNTIYPVSSFYKYINSINNVKIDRANGWVREIAEETGSRFIDTASALKDEDGNLATAYQNGDGLHLSPAALRVVVQTLRTHGYK